MTNKIRYQVFEQPTTLEGLKESFPGLSDNELFRLGIKVLSFLVQEEREGKRIVIVGKPPLPGAPDNTSLQRMEIKTFFDVATGGHFQSIID